MPELPNSAIAPLLYRPLKESSSNHDEQEIRLLSIAAPTTKSDTISCNLQTVSLGRTKGSFFALSYVWGDASDTVPTLVNGHTFQATRNLVEALHHIPAAEPGCEQALWVDAVCINQHDIPERNSQVSIMGHIYKYARRVVCWLGPGDETSDHVIQFIIQLSRDVATRWDGTMDSTPLSEPVYSGLVARIHPHSLLRSPVLQDRHYWQRVWTFQEVVMSRSCRIIAGSFSFLLEELDDILVWMFDLVSSVFGYTGTIKYEFSRASNSEQDAPMREVHPQVWAFVQQVYADTEYVLPARHLCTERRRRARPDLVQNYSDEGLRLIGLLRERKATDARDMIYSAAMLASVGIKVDYTASVHDVYTSYAVSIIEQVSSLDGLLEQAGVTNHASIYAFPSWVPDWSSQADLTTLQSKLFDIRQGAPAKSCSVSTAGNNLCLCGAVVGEIQDAMPQYAVDFDKQTSEKRANSLRKIVEFYFRRESQAIVEEVLTQAPKTHLYPTGITVTTAVLQLLWMGSPASWKGDDTWVREALAPLVKLVVEHEKDPAAMGGLEARKTAGRESSGGEVLLSICDPTKAGSMPLEDLMESIQGLDYDDLVRRSPLVHVGATPFITSSGLLGYAKGPVRPGDVIFAVGSATMPLLLRRSDAGEGYRFLSRCFVAGIMEGEVWMNMEQQGRKLEDIVVV